jgi:hypothetical protein
MSSHVRPVLVKLAVLSLSIVAGRSRVRRRQRWRRKVLPV